MIVIRAHREHQPIGKDPRSHLRPREPSHEFRPECLFHRLGLNAFIQRVHHRLRSSQHHRSEALGPPSLAPYLQKLDLSEPSGTVFLRIGIIIRIYWRPFPQRRKHRASFILSDGKRKRIAPFPIAVPFCVATRTVGLHGRLMSGRSQMSELGN